MYFSSPDGGGEAFHAAMASGQFRGSFSQLGEDAVLWWMFADRRDGYYVDVGCHHPFRFSNTALLHMFRGWRGINIDFDERAITAFRAARPNDINICAAIGEKAERREATLFRDGAINSLDADHANNPAWASLKQETRDVDVLPLRDILEEHLPPGQTIDFLNIDVEGLDYKALRSNNWEVHLPRAIAIEDHGFDVGSPANSPIFQFLTERGYRMIAHIVMTSIYKAGP